MDTAVTVALISASSTLLAAVITIVVTHVIKMLEEKGRILVRFRCRHCGYFVSRFSRDLGKCRRHSTRYQKMYQCPNCGKCRKCKGKKRRYKGPRGKSSYPPKSSSLDGIF